MGGSFLRISTQQWGRALEDLGDRARYLGFGVVFFFLSPVGHCYAEVSPLDRLFSKAPAPDVNSQMGGLEAKVEEARHDLSGLCTSALDSVGSAESGQKLLVKLNGVARKVAAIDASCQELRDNLTNTLKNLDVSGGGYLVEGRKKQAEDLGKKIAKCEELLAKCRTIPPKLEDVKKTFEEADVFRTALADIFGKQSADSETRAALEKRLTELIGPLDTSSRKDNPPPQVTPKTEPIGEAIVKTVEPSVDAVSNPPRGIIIWIAAGLALIGGSGLVFLLRIGRSNRAPDEKLEKIKSPESGKPAPVSSSIRESRTGATILRLTAKNGMKVFETRLDQTFGRPLLKNNFEGKNYFADQQFLFSRTSTGWFFVSLKAMNINNVNGVEVPADARIALKEGDVITIGKAQKCPLRVSLE
jgi:hypothetical protein